MTSEPDTEKDLLKYWITEVPFRNPNESWLKDVVEAQRVFLVKTNFLILN